MMVVMSRTSQLQYSQAGVPASIWVAESRPVDMAEDDTGGLSEEIGSGRAFLKVVAYPWGVEFEVIEREGGR